MAETKADRIREAVHALQGFSNELQQAIGQWEQGKYAGHGRLSDVDFTAAEKTAILDGARTTIANAKAEIAKLDVEIPPV